MDALVNTRKEKFCLEYVKDFNATRAARDAGYSAKTASAIGHTLLQDPAVAARVEDLTKRILTEMNVDQPSILRHWAHVLNADPNELTQNRVGCCRYCYGRDGWYQWRTPREFEEAKAAAMFKHKITDDSGEDPRIPNDRGGYGYNITARPVPDCPECNGLGVTYQVFLDTTMLSESGKQLYRGVKVTKAGMEVLMSDKAKAAEQIARHLGMFKADNSGNLSEDAMAFIAAVSGGKAPLARD